jgi:uncharacterized damage-inducible protein DinB
MDFLKHLHQLFAYDDWANREVLRVIGTAEPPPARSLSLLGHILAAEELWLGRLLADAKPVEIWPAANPEQREARISRLSASWRGCLDGLSAEKLSARIAYVNSKGESWENTVEEVLLHVVMHSAYHRGQIASDLRAAGHTPAYTDFIHGVRQGLVE